MRQIEVDLRNTEIRSPVYGVVVQRNVELGATVAASLQAPTLFLIADDLRRMEIAANIDETDVGRIKAGQRVTFTVNAYPGRTFEGRVKQVRLGSQTVQNVVIYTTIISIENPRHELLPGMTANLRIETDRREDVVRIPNAALRWRPPSIVPDAAAPAPEGRRGQPENAAPGRGAAAARSIAEFVEAIKTELKSQRRADKRNRRGDRRHAQETSRRWRRRAGSRRRGANAAALRGRIWKSASRCCSTPSSATKFDEIRKRLTESGGGARRRSAAFLCSGRDGKPEGVTVRIGATDGGMTEIVSGLEAGRDVIIGGGPRTDAAARAGRVSGSDGSHGADRDREAHAPLPSR